MLLIYGRLPVCLIETRARVQDVVVRAYDWGRRITLIHVAGTHGPPVLYGRFDRLSGRLSPQENVQGIDQSRGWEVRHGTVLPETMGDRSRTGIRSVTRPSLSWMSPVV